MKLKITTIGHSAGAILPRELLARLRVEKGDAMTGMTRIDIAAIEAARRGQWAPRRRTNHAKRSGASDRPMPSPSPRKREQGALVVTRWNAKTRDSARRERAAAARE